jgi:DNA replication ATP-dependent helicase Dna2
MRARGVEFLADAHRLNVALTRAQRKLILIGDREWLAQVPLLARLIAHCEGLYGGHGGMVTARSS